MLNNEWWASIRRNHHCMASPKPRPPSGKRQAVNDSTLPFVSYTVFIPALTQITV